MSVPTSFAELDPGGALNLTNFTGATLQSAERCLQTWKVQAGSQSAMAATDMRDATANAGGGPTVLFLVARRSREAKRITSSPPSVLNPVDKVTRSRPAKKTRRGH